MRWFVLAAALCWSGSVFADQVAAYGWVSAGERAVTVAVPYYAGAPQTVAELLVKEGDRVKQGQKLASTQSRSLATAELAMAKAHLATAEARALPAGPKSNAATVQSLEAEEARASVARAEALLASTEVVAPIDGQVLKILSYPGEAAAGRGLLELGDTNALLIKAELNVADAARVKPGARATIKSDAWAGDLAGAVSRIAPRVERSALTALSSFANVDRQIVEATVQPDAPGLAGARAGAEVTVLIAVDPAAK